MNLWSTRFVSLCLGAAVAACQSAPRSEAPVRYAAKTSASGVVDAKAPVPAAPVPAAPVPAAPVAPSPPTAAGIPAAAGAAGAAAAPEVNGAGAAAGTPEPRAQPPSAGPAKPGAAQGAAAPTEAPRPPVPEQATRLFTQALQAMRAGQVTDAELQLKELAAAYPELAGPQLDLGLLYVQNSRLPEAEAVFEAVLDRHPTSVVAGNELGIVERKLGKFAAAEAAYQRTIAAEPDYAPAYLNLGVLYDLYLAEPQKALEQFERYIQLTGENKQVAGWVVELRKRVGAPAAAKKEPA